MNGNNWFIPPSTSIRDYYGEKIALYFSYLSFYTLFLIPVGIIGIPAFIMQVLYDDYEDESDISNTIFTGVMVIWSIIFYEMWKRREAYLSTVWGQHDFEEDEVERPDFIGVDRRSPIHDRKETYFSPWYRLLRVILSVCVTLFMIGLVFLSIWGLLELRVYLFDKYQGEYFANYILSILSTMNAIQIVIFNQIYNFIAAWLTTFENHKTQTEYEKSLILKTFIFQFINSFNSLFYMAFF
jgi:anoctamin-10